MGWLGWLVGWLGDERAAFGAASGALVRLALTWRAIRSAHGGAKQKVGLDKDVKIYGIGAFGVDSFRLFCEGDLTFTPADKTLRGFSEWQKKRRVKK